MPDKATDACEAELDHFSDIVWRILIILSALGYHHAAFGVRTIADWWSWPLRSSWRWAMVSQWFREKDYFPIV
jgi:hypothetical protein